MERSPEKYSSFLSVQFMKRMRYERRGDVTLLQSTFHTRHASRSGFPVILVSISEGTIETNGYFLSELDAFVLIYQFLENCSSWAVFGHSYFVDFEDI